jgi:hypothetical protein
VNSKWKYLRRLLRAKKDISLETSSSVPYISLPRPRYIFNIFSTGNAFGRKPSKEDEKAIGRKELYDYFIKESNLPIIENRSNPEYTTKKEGKTNKGRQSQLDLQRTLRKKMERLVVEGKMDVDSLFDEPFVDNDLVYNRYALKEHYRREAIVINVVDVSGSISDIERIIGKSLIIGLLQFFGKKFHKTDFYCITHEHSAKLFGPVQLEKRDDPMKILDEEKGKPLLEFSKFRGGGGTSIKEVIEILEDIKKAHPKTPIYLFYSGDLEIFTEELIDFKKKVTESGIFDFYGFMIYNRSSDADALGTPANKSSILVMGRGKSDPVKAISWVFKHLGKQGTFEYAEN